MNNTARVVALFFSPTLTTKKYVLSIAEGIREALKIESAVLEVDVTTPVKRNAVPQFADTDIVVWGVPVYIGRVPNLIAPFFKQIKGGGAIGVPVVVYGNRAYDDALIELRDIMVDGGFKVVAGGAFIGEHSFSYTLGGGRPNKDDLQQGCNFGMQIGEEILSGRYNNLEGKELKVPGNPYPYAFYNAKSKQNKSIDIRKVKPETNMDICNSCGICAMLCPMGAINVASCADVPGICIKCGACVKRCPRNAKSFTDPTYLEHKQILETNFTVPAKENELFFV
ncbi:MAG: 4Fe-4S binding protein [Bacteroidales bacterium]|nr:4Fe-4S binding protein [Bacteroidales bacterium]